MSKLRQILVGLVAGPVKYGPTPPPRDPAQNLADWGDPPMEPRFRVIRPPWRDDTRGTYNFKFPTVVDSHGFTLWLSRKNAENKPQGLPLAAILDVMPSPGTCTETTEAIISGFSTATITIEAPAFAVVCVRCDSCEDRQWIPF